LKPTTPMAHPSEAALDNRIDKLLLAAFEKDAENIRALARIAEIRDHRLSDLEGGERKN
jgi:hypothetical protein